MDNKCSFAILLVVWLVAAAMSFNSDNVQLGKRFQAKFERRVIFHLLLMPLSLVQRMKGGGWEGGGDGRWNKKSNQGDIRCPVLKFHFPPGQYRR